METEQQNEANEAGAREPFEVEEFGITEAPFEDTKYGVPGTPFAVEECVVPGAPIVRASTVRPRSLGFYPLDTSDMSGQATPLPTGTKHLALISMDGSHLGGQTTSPPTEEQETLTAFPAKAPSAPPLPEELDEPLAEEESAPAATPLPAPAAVAEVEAVELAPEFAWLFEYALAMDSVVAYSATELEGLALLYGPAVLKGYKLAFDVLNSRHGTVVATIVPSREPGAQVWGVLYRVPHHVTQPTADAYASLDKLHSATPPDGLFERAQVVVQESYRQRQITCLTYIASATARNLFHLLPRRRQVIDELYAERLLEIARQQKLPDSYLQELQALAKSDTASAAAASNGANGVMAMRPAQQVATAPPEQNTEPLFVLGEREHTGTIEEAAQEATATPAAASAPTATTTPAAEPPAEWEHGKMIFALYLALLLLVVLALAVLQGVGVGANLFVASFTSLGVPWFVLVYGLLGGCISCLVRLGWQSTRIPPNFVLVTWFTRPFIGAVLAIIVYLLLNTGFIALGGSAAQHEIVFALLGTLAGACEGWLF